MNIHSSPLNARPNKWALLKCQTTAFRHGLSTSARKVVRTVCSSNLDPWKTLGVSYDADEKQIKKAYRKLALDNHPDLRGSEAAARFVKIQEAYEVVTGKRRGATADPARKSSTAAAGWDFHDWYWKFTAGKRWDAQRSKGPHSPAAEAARLRPTGAPEEALRAQLAGLRRKAAFRARSRPSASYQQSGESSASDVHSGEAASAGFHSSSEQPESTFVGHDEFPESQLAGLKRQARNRQQQQQATSDPQTLYQTVNAAAAETEEVQASVTGKQSDQVRAVAAAAGGETRADAQAPAAEAAGAAVGESVLKCARDFMAEVRARSTSSNIVAATFTGLRAHLAPTIAHLAHLSSAGGDSATVPESDPSITTKSGTCVKTSTFQYSASEAGSGEARGQRPAAEDGCGGRRQSAQADSAQIRRELACQLAGLKRRAAIRQYPA